MVRSMNQMSRNKALFFGLVGTFFGGMGCESHPVVDNEVDTDANTEVDTDANTEVDTDANTDSDSDAGSDVECDEVGAQVFSEGVLHRIEISISSANWQALLEALEEYAADESLPHPYFEGSIKYDDFPTLDGVGIRTKGNHSVLSALTLGRSFPFKIDIDRFQPNQVLDGLKKLNLHPIVDDPEVDWEWPSDPVADYVSYKAMRAHGAPTSRVAFAEVFVNDVSQGLYSVVEQISGGFIKCNFPEPWGDLYKPDTSLTLAYEGDDIDAYSGHNHKWPDTTDHQPFLALIDTFEYGSNTELEQALDIDGALSYFVLNIGLGNWDYYNYIPHNYYLYESTPGKFTAIPWDMNMSQVDWTEPCGLGTGGEGLPLSHRLLGDADYLQRYSQIFRDFLEGAGSIEAQHNTIDEVSPFIGDWISTTRLDDLRSNITNRVTGLLDKLDGLKTCPEEIEW